MRPVEESRVVRGLMRLRGPRVDLGRIDRILLVVAAGIDRTPPSHQRDRLLWQVAGAGVTGLAAGEDRVGVMGSRVCRELWLHIAAWRGERSLTVGQRAMRAVVARERTGRSPEGGPRGWLGRLGEVGGGRVVRVRGGWLLIPGQLGAVDGGVGV